MQFVMNYSLIFILFIGLTIGELHNVCELCKCDNLDKPIIVYCDSKELSSLSNITFNSTIETLSFRNNSLTFKSVEDLEKINNLTSLKSLILSQNPLTTIPAFSLAHLVDLQLEKTDLKSIAFPKSYENCSDLQSIVLLNNALIKITSDNFKSLSSLTKIFLDNTQLKSIDPNAFNSISNKLQNISFESNFLKSAEFLSTMTNLLSINFDKNNFQELPIEMIKPGGIKHFFFRDNKINIIDELSPLFHWMKADISDINIYLNNNPLDCCRSRWFIYYLTGPKNLVKDSFNLTCASPGIYAGRKLIDLRADLMDCSNEPFYPSNMSTKAIVIISLIGLGILILSLIGLFLYRRNKLHFGRRQQYEPIGGENLPDQI